MSHRRLALASPWAARPIDSPEHRDLDGQVDVALVTATNVMRAQLKQATGDDLAVDVALRVMAPALAAFSAALAAQAGRA